MNLLFTFFCLFFISTAHANVWDGSISLEQDYACLGIDGVPIGNSSALADTCCSDHQLVANAPASCRAGFQTIVTDAGNGAAGGINIAQHGLDTSGGLDGANTNGSNSPPNLGGTGSTYHPGEGSATVSGGTSSGGIGSSSGGGTSATGSGGYKGGTGSGSASGGSGGSGLTVGASGSTAGKSDSEVDPNASQKSNGSGYVKGGGDGKGTAGGAGGMFGNGAGGSTAGVGAGSANELAFGEGKDTAGGDGSGANGEDGDGKGSSEDPSDYFSRIDKSADIFKIVSARYLKKKTLWTIPQKAPEELKHKGI